MSTNSVTTCDTCKEIISEVPSPWMLTEARGNSPAWNLDFCSLGCLKKYVAGLRCPICDNTGVMQRYDLPIGSDNRTQCTLCKQPRMDCVSAAGEPKVIQ